MNAFQSLIDELASIRAAGQFRSMRRADTPPSVEFELEGKRLLNFSSNDYLGLATHPRLIAAANAATERWGTGSTASRLICGNLGIHEDFENELVAFKGAGIREARALLFNSGYHANTGIIPALTAESDVIFSDELNHASLIDGCRLSRAKKVRYRHNDVTDLASKLAENEGARRKLIVSDSVFSMDGDCAPLREIVELAEKFDAWVMVDEAHGTGVLGSNGRGLVDELGLRGRVHLQMGTLGKALGSFGAYVVAPAPFIELLVNRARSLIFTTGLPPAPVAAALEAVNMLRESDDLRLRLHENIRFFSNGLRELGLLDRDWSTPIFPIVLGEEDRTMKAMANLLEAGIFGSGIRPPTVPPGTCRLRLTVTAAHSRAHLEAGLTALKESV